MRFTPLRRTALLLFLGLSGCYLALSPNTVGGRGYITEELSSGMRMIEVGSALIDARPLPSMVWSRHGPIPVLFDLPFIELGRFVHSPDFMLSFQPALLTAALITVLFLWLRTLCAPGMSLFLALTAAFGTMLWPYAYIGLETKQSFFVLLSGYLGLAQGRIRGWPRLLLFGVSCGLALTLKSNGVVMGPVVAFLVYEQFRRDWRTRQAEALTTVIVIGAFAAVSAVGRMYYWDRPNISGVALRFWLIDSPLLFFPNAVGLLGSPTKGLFVFAPALIVSLFAIPQVLRARRPIAIFTLLVIGCTVLLLSIFTAPADEVWGCRYLHLAIAPLVVCIGAAWPRFEWRRDTPLLALAMLGLVISFLGTFSPYGTRGTAAEKAGQNTMQWLTGDSVWNEVAFSGRVFRAWMKNGNAPVPWTPKHVWVWVPPPDAPAWKTLNLRDYSEPQSFLLRMWNVPLDGAALAIFNMHRLSAAFGLLSLLWVMVRTTKERRAAGP